MPIILQSSVGGFSADFMLQLPLMEEVMVEKGLEPSDFVIAKNAAQYPVPYLNIAPEAGGQFDYTVFVAGGSFTVTFQSDMRFLEYFYRRCVAEEKSNPAGKFRLMASRLSRWLKGKPDFL